MIADPYHPNYPEFMFPFSDGVKAKKRKKPKKTKMGKRRLTLLAINPHCKYCNKELNENSATVDHVIPRSKGGSNDLENLVLACRPCNNAKGDKIIPGLEGKMKSEPIHRPKKQVVAGGWGLE